MEALHQINEKLELLPQGFSEALINFTLISEVEPTDLLILFTTLTPIQQDGTTDFTIHQGNDQLVSIIGSMFLI